MMKLSLRSEIKQMGLLALLALSIAMPVRAETVCAQVKMQIKQQLTLERQGFDAEMQIHNTLDNVTLSDVSIDVKVMDEKGNAVPITADSNNLAAKFYIRVSNKQNIADVSGNGVVNPATTAVINWLLVPAPGAAGDSPLGKKYLVGATLKYKMQGEMQTLEVAPDTVTVKPMPLMTLDYFLTRDVMADDPLTAEVEPVVPFTLGVRVKNAGYAAAKSLKIDSAQPKIIENKQGLQIGFALTGSYLNDAPAQNTLLLNFGDVAAGSSKMGRWIMETTLAGKFTEFSAKFSHADELGGTLTSLIKAVNTHFLLRDVRVDLPGRDLVRDFLAQDAEGGAIKIYESDATLDADVVDLSAQASLSTAPSANGHAVYRLSMPASQGFVYVKLPDPFKGQKALGQILRADGKKMLSENVWLSRTMNANTGTPDYWIHFFDANTPGVYDTEFDAPPATAKPPVIQAIPDITLKETKASSWVVDASSPDGKALILSAAPLPSGATFAQQPSAAGLASAVFDWTPAKGQAGSYLVVFSASDGSLTTTRTATLRVETNDPPPGPLTPSIEGPISGAEITTALPVLVVQTSSVSQDPTSAVQFEIYKDEAMSQLLESAVVKKGMTTAAAGTTSYTPQIELNDNTTYWWRARAFDGQKTYSNWANGQFRVNLFNDAPDSFNLTYPAPAAEVASLNPVLSWTNSTDKDGDAIRYRVQVYKDAALTDKVSSAIDLPAGDGGVSSWTVEQALLNHATYYWQVVAVDEHGAEYPTPSRSFIVNTGNTAPTEPVIVSPQIGGQSALAATTLSIQNAQDAEKDLITYVFELDVVNTFDSGNKRSSGQLIQGSGVQTSWTVNGLTENQRYFWRVKAQDSRSESAWVQGDFLLNAQNDLPPVPTIQNPGNGAWSSSLYPGLTANPVKDPEGDAVSYQFEVYRNAALTTKVAGAVVGTTSWQPTTALADKTTYWWRVRALDAQGAASDWSASAVLYVSSSAYQTPSIQLISPSRLTVPSVVNDQKLVTLRWIGTGPNIEPTVALYFDSKSAGFNGQLIIDGLRQDAGTQNGEYVWDVSKLAPGAYYVYAMIYDSKGVGRAYAPAAVVIPASNPAGSLVAKANSTPLETSETGDKAKFKLRLGSKPVADVLVPVASSNPREGVVSQASVLFTPDNWSSSQTVNVIGQMDCMKDKNSKYQILLGKVESLDPNYMGISAVPIPAINEDDGKASKNSITDNSAIFVCNYSLVGKRKLTNKLWEYTVTAELTNAGRDVRSLRLTLNNSSVKNLPYGVVQLTDAVLDFGAVGAGETVKSSDTITIRSTKSISPSVFIRSIKYRWAVEAK